MARDGRPGLIRTLVRGILGIVVAVLAGMLRSVLLGGRMGGRAIGPPAAAGAARLESTGFRRAAGGSGAWLASSVGLASLRAVRRMGQRKREVVWSGSLTPGQKLVVRHLSEDRKGRSAG